MVENLFFCYTGEEVIMCGGSPLINEALVVLFFIFIFVKMSGRFTGEENYNSYSRSPLSEPDSFSVFSNIMSRCRGDYTG